jgi:protein associated with RNAse G/E
MNNFIYFITMLMTTILVLFMIGNLYGCAFMVAKETVKVVDIVLDGDPNPDKKIKIIEKQNLKKESNKKKAQEFYCKKIKDPVKCK